MSLFNTQRLAIDLGSFQTVIYVDRKGVALREPSIVALNKDNEEIEAIGQEAYDLMGKTSDAYEFYYPIQNGVIHSYTLAQRMLVYFIKKVSSSWIKPEVVITVPSQISKVERKALVDIIKDIGINRAMIIDQPYAAAIGANLAVEEPKGRMLIDIGYGTTDIATLSYGEIISTRTIPYSSGMMDNFIKSHLRENYQIIVGDQTARYIKHELGNAKYDNKIDKDDVLLAQGFHLGTGSALELEVEARVVADAISEVIEQIVYGAHSVLEDTPPELAADILTTGIVLTGGGALLRRLPERIYDELQIPAHLVQTPFDTVALGAGMMFNEMHKQTKEKAKKLR